MNVSNSSADHAVKVNVCGTVDCTLGTAGSWLGAPVVVGVGEVGVVCTCPVRAPIINSVLQEHML